ncbi:MAG: glycosyltransferase family 2 protein [Rhizobiaceae bacterium]
MQEYGENETPLVSIIIPVKNGLPEFRRVVESVKKQSFSQGYEVIVIDSGSTDGSPDIIPKDDPRFRLIEIEPAQFGHGKTRNLGIANSKGVYCAFLTHDAVPANDKWLKTLVQPLIDDPGVAGVFGRHIAYDDASPYTAWELETHFDGLKSWPCVEIDDAREYARNEGLRQIYHFYSDNSSCLRKSVWEKIPYPDVDFSEDQLWAKQIIEAGYKKAFAWQSVVYHSHEYSLFERLQRSFDESLALRRLFGYKLCPTRTQILRQTIRTSARDLAMGIKNGWIFSHPITTAKKPFDNLARQIGYYLGSNDSGKLAGNPGILSRDKRIQSS